MANSDKDLPRLYQDALKEFLRIARKMGDSAEGVFMRNAISALRRKDVKSVVDFLKLIYKSDNLSPGDKKVLIVYMNRIQPSRFAWLNQLWILIRSVPLEYWEKFVVWLWETFRHDTPLIYWRNYGSLKIHTSSTYKRFRFYFSSGTAGFCKKSSIPLWACY